MIFRVGVSTRMEEFMPDLFNPYLTWPTITMEQVLEN